MVNFFKSQLFTFICSWSLALAFIILGGSLYSHFFPIFVFIYTWVPGLVALHFYSLEKMRIPLKFKWNPNFLWAALLALALGTFIMVLSLPFSELRRVDYLRSILPNFLSHFTLFTMIFLFVFLGLLVSLIGGATLYLFVTLGHEMMWRGYVWNKLKFLGFWRASLIMGLFWGLFQAPLILMGYCYPEHPFLGVFWIILYSVNISPLLLYYRIKSQNVLGPAIFHGVLCTFSAMSIFLFTTPNSLLVGLGGMTGIIACILFNLLLFFKIRKTPLLEYEI